MKPTTNLTALSAALVVLTAALAVTAISTAGVRSKAAATKVTVTFTDRAFRVAPTGLESGTTTFVVRNTGKKNHVFAISGPGLKSVHTPAVPAGKSATLTVKLRTGSYMLSDPVGLGPYSVQYVDVIHSTAVTSVGNPSVVSPPMVLPPMCGGSIAP